MFTATWHKSYAQKHSYSNSTVSDPLGKLVLLVSQRSYTLFCGNHRKCQSGRGVMLTPHPLLVPWSWTHRAIPLLPLRAIWPVQSLSICTRVHFTLLYRKCQQLTSIDSFWNCMTMMWCPGNRLPNAAMSAFGTDNVMVENRSGWWSSSMTAVKTACVEELIQKKRYVMLLCKASDLG